ncbi:MAG TPA: hypothetical protein VL995_10700 [Cellvibrio sp.]|nr:hypothetical protein [Cellvibrio sp.]
MHIPSEQFKTLNGAMHTIPLNGDYTFVQVTIKNGNTGIVTATIRPLLEANGLVDFQDDGFEGIEGGVVDLGANPKKRTFTIENRRCSALRLVDAGNGSFKVYIN